MLMSVHAQILCIGRETRAALEPMFERIGYGSEVVAYAESQADGRAFIRDNAPAVVVMRVPCGTADCMSWARIRREARAANQSAMLVALADDQGCEGLAYLCIPWPVTFDSFTEAMERAVWVFAVSQRNGWRGGGPPEAEPGESASA